MDLVGHDWGALLAMRVATGLVLLLPDPPVEEARSLEMAERLGARTARLGDLEHCWMAQDPLAVAGVLRRFWADCS